MASKNPDTIDPVRVAVKRRVLSDSGRHLRPSGALAPRSMLCSTLGTHPSDRVRAAAMVDRWIEKHFDATLDFSDGDLFERALSLQQEFDGLAMRLEASFFNYVLDNLRMSPFADVRRRAREAYDVHARSITDPPTRD